MPSRILIADDHEDNRELLCFLLRSALYDVIEACDGEECLQVARDQRPDLIMVDISMPMLDGWEVFQQLRADDRTRNIPCIAVTAYAESDRQRALAVGFNAYLSKPFRGEEALATVRRLIPQEAGLANAASSVPNEQ